MTSLKIASVYIRVSTNDQIEYSPDSQLSKIKEYAKKNGYVIPEEYIFIDEGISGRKAEKRPQFMKMIGIAKQKPKPFDAILVWKYSRFARSREDSIVYKSMLRKQCKIDVLSVSEDVGDDKMSILIEALIEAMDEFYSVNLSEEVTRGMTEKASRGEPTCPPPFGYVIKEGNYYPDEESGKANIIREIFNLYANGAKQREIAVMLGERGVRTKFGNNPDNRWINYALQNPCYIGRIRWSLDGARAVSKRDYSNEKIMVVDGHHEPLISMELWETVQSKLEYEKNTYAKYAKRGQPIAHMLKGLVRCSECGGTLAITGYSGKAKTPCLQCCNYNAGRCHTPNGVLLPKIEDAVMKGLRQAIGTNTFVISPKARKVETSSVPNYEKLLAIEERRLERSKQAYLNEVDSLEQYAENKKEIEKRIAELIALRDAETPQDTHDFNAYAKKVMQVVEFLEREDVTAEAKNEALQTIIEKIVFNKSTGNVAIFFCE